jgi:tryptophan synthase alpha chain
MNRIDRLFRNKPREILSVYFTAGYPKIDDTQKIIETLDHEGVDMIEVGIPFSDPMVDGPVIQESNKVALENGMNLNRLFEQIYAIRKITDIPLLLMGYLNPVFHYGMEKFCRACNHAGIDGVILPDLPVEVYRQQYKNLFRENNLFNIFLVTPYTKTERLQTILSEARGFVYMVSSSATTGKLKRISEHLNYVREIQEIRQDMPVMVGFGIDSHKKFRQVCNHASGGIIGSAFIRQLHANGSLEPRIGSFIRSIKKTG